MTKPSLQNISISNVLQILGMTAVAFATFLQLSWQAETNAAEIEKITKVIASAEAKAEADIRDHETRLRRLEDSAARSDERMTNILNLLARIDGRLERIERAN
jgi:septal ring factor EnvC (AmiA/AmiB activator)